MIRIGLLVSLALLAAAGGSASAQVRADASGSITIERGLNISTVSPMELRAARSVSGGTTTGGGGANVTSAGGGDSPAIIAVTGDPGRLYRVRMPQFIDAGGQGTIETLIIRSRNAGDISKSRVGRMDASGQDVLTVTGRLHTKRDEEVSVTTTVPLSVDYE